MLIVTSLINGFTLATGHMFSSHSPVMVSVKIGDSVNGLAVDIKVSPRHPQTASSVKNRRACFKIHHWKFWKPRVVIMSNLSSLVVMEVVFMANSNRLCHHWRQGCHNDDPVSVHAIEYVILVALTGTTILSSQWNSFEGHLYTYNGLMSHYESICQPVLSGPSFKIC